ncbi:MAG: phospholipase D-like domain-containing protein [Simkaniaceae bacterium]|nr:phospholipase D-like domain-containing protein [Simkaniaceae bacterium]
MCPISFVLFKLFIATHLFLYPFPSIEEEFRKRFSSTEAVSLDELDQGYAGFCTRDSIESNHLKFEMIRAAQKSIVLSGCYCGGQIFNDALDLIFQRLSHNPELDVQVLCSTIWLEPSNVKKMGSIAKHFPQRFHYTVYREKNLAVNSVDSRARIASNHVKSIIIDYGRYFMIGGSALQDRWSTHTGEESLPPLDLPAYALLTQESMAPQAFRDCDFMFKSESSSGVGRRLYFEMMKLISRWQLYDLQRGAREKIALDEIPKNLPDVSTTLPSIDSRIDLVKDVKVAGYVSGPDLGKGQFYQEMLEQIRNAKSSIYINHLYFHPSKEMMQALVEASKRPGMKITIVTNPVTAKSPGLHFLFAALNRYYLSKVVKRCAPSSVSLFEFHRDFVTLHKKIVIFDNKTVLTGSSNIGYVSMRIYADYEFDLKIESEPFAAHTLAMIQEDQNKYSIEVDKDEITRLNRLIRLLLPLQVCIEFLL